MVWKGRYKRVPARSYQRHTVSQIIVSNAAARWMEVGAAHEPVPRSKFDESWTGSSPVCLEPRDLIWDPTTRRPAGYGWLDSHKGAGNRHILTWRYGQQSD